MILVLLTAVVLAAAASGCGGSAGSTAASGHNASGEAAGGGSVSAATPQQSPASSRVPALRVVFVRVGQGDAAVLRSGAWSGLVDGGPSGSGAAVRAALAQLGVRRLDTLVVSHQHADHTGGLTALVRQYRPRRAWVAGALKGGLARALRAAGTLPVQVRGGHTARFGKTRVRVLAPARMSGDANTDSVVLLLQAGGRRVVFTGDSTGAGEAAAGASLARGPPVDVLKVAHHGSRYSTTRRFLAAARPRVAIISVGANSYGHPSNDTVRRLRAGGARVFSTQKNGSVTLTITSGGALRWRFARSSAPLVRGVSR